MSYSTPPDTGKASDAFQHPDSYSESVEKATERALRKAGLWNSPEEPETVYCEDVICEYHKAL